MNSATTTMTAFCLVALTACGGTAPDPAEPQVEAVERHVESETCRQDVAPVLAILRQALDDADVRDAAGRLVAIEELGTAPTAQCSPALTSAVREGVKSMSCALDIAIAVGMDTESPDCGAPDVGTAFAETQKSLTQAEEAVAATTTVWE